MGNALALAAGEADIPERELAKIGGDLAACKASRDRLTLRIRERIGPDVRPMGPRWGVVCQLG